MRATLVVVSAVVVIVGAIAIRRTAPVRTLLVVGAVVAIVGGLAVHAREVDQPGLDFTINRVAAQRLLDGKELYDSEAARPAIVAHHRGEHLQSRLVLTLVLAGTALMAFSVGPAMLGHGSNRSNPAALGARRLEGRRCRVLENPRILRLGAARP